MFMVSSCFLLSFLAEEAVSNAEKLCKFMYLSALMGVS